MTQERKIPDSNLTTESYRLNKRIGSTNYLVTVHFSQTSKETINDKIMRLIKNETILRKAANE